MICHNSLIFKNGYAIYVPLYNVLLNYSRVELYATVGHNAAEGLGTKMLNIRYGKMAATENFGNNEAVGLDEKVYATATPEKSYTKDGEILDFDEYFIVRVNPINAKFTKDDVKIINSLGKDLSGIVEIKDVKQWDELLTRAGETANNGLWKVTVKRAEGVSEAAYKDAVQSDNENILFAVAINNTGKDETADRYVASTFEMTINPEADYEPVTSLDFYVGKFNVDELKNRWSDATGTCVAVDEDGTSLNAGLKEYKWTSASLAVFDENKVSNDVADARFNDKDYYPAEVGEKFTIDLSKVKGNEDVQWYYVTLDENFANVKSSPSELNAWQSYDYVGLYTMTAASDKLDITVNNPTDKEIDAYGDVIGFRVFAVNYDGTLVDPDGKAFYIKLGDATNKQEKDVKITVTTPGANESGYIAIDKFLPFSGSCTNVTTGIETKASDKMDAGAAITFSLYKDQNGTSATDWKDAKYVKVKFNAANKFEDGGTFVATAEVKDGNRTVNTLTLNVTKVMPTPETIAGKFAFNATQLVNNVYTCYLDPEVNWSTASNTGNKDLSSVAVMGKFNTADYYTWVFENATIKNNQPAALEVKDNKLSVNKAFINDDEHATAIYYTFDDLSYAKNSSGSYEVGDYAVEAKTCTTIFACTFSKPVFDYAWKQYEEKDEDGNVTKRDINYVVWGSNKWDEKVDNYANWIIGTSKVNNGVYGGTFMDTYAKNFVSVSARLYSNETGKEDYYTVTWMGSATTPYFAFTPVAGKENPTTDVASTLEITVIDAFGHKTVYPLPFTIKKQ